MDLLEGRKKRFSKLLKAQAGWDSIHLESEMIVIRTWLFKWHKVEEAHTTSSEMIDHILLVQRSLMRYQNLLSQALAIARSPSSMEIIWTGKNWEKFMKTNSFRDSFSCPKLILALSISSSYTPMLSDMKSKSSIQLLFSNRLKMNLWTKPSIRWQLSIKSWLSLMKKLKKMLPRFTKLLRNSR